MVRKLVTLHPRMHVFDGIAVLLKHNISGAPVVDADRNYLGVFSEKCCMGVLTLTARAARESGAALRAPLRARDFMVTRLVTLSPQTDAFEAIGLLLKHRISGAPVVEEDGTFLGVFSEKFSMRVLIDAAYDQLPSCEVAAFMNTDFGRTITEQLDLLKIAQIFLDTPYRRLPVLRAGKLVGQISRRDVLRAEHHLSEMLRDRVAALLENGGAIDASDGNEVRPLGELPSPELEHFMDARAHTITADTDLLEIVQVFLNTNYRRLPVLHEGKLVGQISRRDVLQAIHDTMAVAPQREKALLYLSSLVEREEAPFA